MKLKRLVSAVLAIGMALTILPTAAFAAGNTIGSSEVGGLEITEAGYPKVPESVGTIDIDGITIKRELYSTNTTPYLDKVIGTGWECQIYQGSLKASNMTIAAGYTYAGSDNTVSIIAEQ
jgi:hypothetical protein